MQPKNSSTDNGFVGGLITGLSLGIVWTPCAGPILATIATLAATQEVNTSVILLTLAYVLGVAIPPLLFGMVGNALFTRTRALNKYTSNIQQIFGIIMVLTAISIATGYDRHFQARLLDTFPSYSAFVYKLESNKNVEKQLDVLKKDTKSPMPPMPFYKASDLPNIAPAPEFVGITAWLNTKSDLTLQELRGQVVLVDFWTYTCINCIRTFPYTTKWYEKYKDKGFVIVGIHTPEFEFEKKTDNVVEAMKQYGITYPVGQDNSYSTWRAYDNRYWPAHYLIDTQGVIRYIHFGEGNYDKTETAIQQLLEEAGNKAKKDIPKPLMNNSFWKDQTPETYLGLARLERFDSTKSDAEKGYTYSAPRTLPVHHFAYSGNWKVDMDYGEVVQSGAEILLHYAAQNVFLVITPPEGGGSIAVELDGKPVTADDAGKDVKDSVVTLDTSRLYELIRAKSGPGNHTLKLRFFTPGTQVFAFTFGS